MRQNIHEGVIFISIRQQSKEQISELVTCNMNNCVLDVAISGEIDHHNARSIRGAIDEKLYSCRPKQVRLNVSNVTFMDSSGLGLILGRFTLARELGGELKLIDPSPGVSKILELAGTARLITIERSDEKCHENT